MESTQRPARRPRPLLRGAGLLAAGVGVALALPPRTDKIRSQARPCRSYAEALAGFARLQARDDLLVNPGCRARLLDHGEPTESVVILLHGMTNCPLQCLQLGEHLQQAGHTVLIPRLPQNGLRDRRTDALSRLRAADLAACGDEAVDIAVGLGQRVRVFGLSAGGLVAAWVAQHREDVERVIIAAPALGIRSYPLPVQALLRNALLRVPNLMVDDGREEAARKQEHNYVRKSSRSLGELMLLGESVLRSARRRPPAAAHVVMMVNAADTVISNELVNLLAGRWLSHPGARVTIHEFAEAERLGHDIVDPLQPTARTDVVYPIIQGYIEQ